jgi:hypothetical protein
MSHTACRNTIEGLTLERPVYDIKPRVFHAFNLVETICKPTLQRSNIFVYLCVQDKITSDPVEG